MKRVFETAECEAVRNSIIWELRYEKQENQMKGCGVELRVSLVACVYGIYATIEATVSHIRHLQQNVSACRLSSSTCLFTENPQQWLGHVTRPKPFSQLTTSNHSHHCQLTDHDIVDQLCVLSRNWDLFWGTTSSSNFLYCAMTVIHSRKFC